jgi:hypothetical protein
VSWPFESVGGVDGTVAPSEPMLKKPLIFKGFFPRSTSAIRAEWTTHSVKLMDHHDSWLREGSEPSH